MSFIGNLLDILSVKAAQPQLFGWFHILCILLCVGSGVLLRRLFPQGSEKQVRTVLFVTAVVAIVLEVYKQIVFTFTFNGETITADYQWYAFPFQLCSAPMYIGLLASLTKGSFHKALCGYLVTYAMFSGGGVMVYPGDVFVDTVGINIQTMFCHGSMISIGIYLIFTGYVKTSVKTLFQAMPVFLTLVGIAVSLNEVAHLTGLTDHETFNMFFISPYSEPYLPVYSLVQRNVPFPWCLIAYVAVVTGISGMILLILAGIKHCIERKKS